MPISHTKKVIFIYIPKNAGTSVSSIKEFKFFEIGHKPYFYYKSRYTEEWNHYFSFAITRNPWDRLVSSYEYAIMPTSFWHSKKTHSLAGVHPDYDLLKDLSFEQTIDLLYKKPKVFKHQGWATQCSWVCFEETLMINKTFRFEDITTDKEFIRLTNGKIERYNKSDRKSPNYKDYYATQESIDKAAEIYNLDIKMFNYSF